MNAALLLLAALQTADVTEPATGVTFPAELPASTGIQVLTGTGVRTRTVLRVKVYAFGLYVDQAGGRAALAAWRDKSAAELARDQALYAELLKGGFPMMLRLVMTRDVGGDQMAEAFNDALAPRVGSDTAALTRFRAFFSDRLSKGTELLFSWRPGNVLGVAIGGREVGTVESEALCRALFDVYLGEKPISSDGKKTVIARLPEMLRS